MRGSSPSTEEDRIRGHCSRSCPLGAALGFKPRLAGFQPVSWPPRYTLTPPAPEQLEEEKGPPETPVDLTDALESGMDADGRIPRDKTWQFRGRPGF